MSGKVKVSGTWRDSTAPYVKVGGNWKIAKSAWAKVDDKWKSWFLQGGVLDLPLGSEDDPEYSNFITNAGTGANNTVNAIVVQSDGKILVGGQLTAFNSSFVNYFVRLNSNGTLDTEFRTNIGTSFNATIYSIALQSDGKIVVGGNFSSFNGTSSAGIARLNSDGTLDTTFTTNIGIGANNAVKSVAIQSDGKVLAGGDFSSFNGTTVGDSGGIVRLNSDGTLDTAFDSNAGIGPKGDVDLIVVQLNGKILLAGGFTTFSGTTVNRIARLNSDGSLDTAFASNTGTGASSDVSSLALQSDNKILIGGGFVNFNGTSAGGFVRLNSDGTRDTAFTTNIGTGFNGTVLSIAVQSDNKIILGGQFTTFNGTTVNRIVRLNSDGTRDTAFTSNTGTGANGNVNSIAVQSDNKIILGGSFGTFNGAAINRIIQLSNEGINLLIPGFNNTVNSINIQNDNKIVIAGAFTAFDGTNVGKIVRLNLDNSLDTTFTSNIDTGANLFIFALAIQSDGKILVGGQFTSFNGTSINRMLRLNSDGTSDTSFNDNLGTGFNVTVEKIKVQSDGKILVSGQFTTFNGTTVNRIVRLNSDGTRDTAFTSNTGTGAPTTIFELDIQSDNKIILGGQFTTFNGTTVNRIVRLNSDGTRDTAFTSNTGTGANNTVNAIVVQSDGKILVGGQFTAFNETTINRIVRLNSDGTLDTAFVANVGAGFLATVNKIKVQLNQKIVISGGFSSFNGIGTNRILRLNPDGTLDTAFVANVGTLANSSITEIAFQSDEKIIIGGVFIRINDESRYRIARIGGEIAA